MRAQLEKKLAQKEKEKKEEHLRQLAQKAREERAGIRTLANHGKNFNWLFLVNFIFVKVFCSLNFNIMIAN